MASRTDKDEVTELAEELDINYPVNTKQQTPGSSTKFYATEGQRQELLMTNMEKLINHFDNHLEEKKEIESLKKQLKEKENEIKDLQKEAAAELNTHKNEMQTLKSENQKLNNELASCKDDAKTALNTMMTEKEKAIHKLQNDIKIEKTKITSVEERLINMLASAIAEKNAMKCTTTKLEEKVKKTEQFIKLLQFENSGSQKQIAEKPTRYDELKRDKLPNEQLAELDPNEKEIRNLKNLLASDASNRKLNELDLRSNLRENSTSLCIHNRMINHVAPGTFDNLSSLTHLDFHCCGLTFLENGVFNNLTNLLILGLSHNYLTCLDGNVFAGLKKLKTIYLFNNNITSIPEKLFGDCVQLEHVRLNDNKIVRLEKTIFDSLHNLTLLYLYNNRLAERDKNALRMLKIGDLKM